MCLVHRYDVAPGYDHITSAIGAAMAAWYGGGHALLRHAEGASWAAYLEDVRQGVIAYKIAAHSADLARRRIGAATATTR